MARHKHADLLIKLAEDDSLIIQVQSSDSDWINAIKHLLHHELNYRIKPTKPSIDWSHVATEFVALAKDADGGCYLYTSTPTPTGLDVWQWAPDSDKENIRYSSARAFKSLCPGTCDWKESLVLRSDCE